jgi:hypothetical protein
MDYDGHFRQFNKFNELLNKPTNNILVDIHSCPITTEDSRMDSKDYFTTVPRGIYVVLISELGQYKIGTDDVQHVDRKMYKIPSWPWDADPQVVNAAQIYFPGDRIFNPLMMFGEPKKEDANFDMFDLCEGNPYKSFNKNDPNLIGKEKYKTYTRANILTYLRGNTRETKHKIIYIPTCDPFGNKPEKLSTLQWKEIMEARKKLQTEHHNIFENFKEFIYPDRHSFRFKKHSPNGRCAWGVDWYDREHFTHFTHDTHDTSVTPYNEGSILGPIQAVSKKYSNLNCRTECKYKETCLNKIPLVGDIVKSCQHKYCTFVDDTTGVCVESSKKMKGGKRKIKKKKTKRRKTKVLKRRKTKRRKHKRKSRKTRKKR